MFETVTSLPDAFTSAPPAEQGGAGYVAQWAGGVLGIINAPAMFIDTLSAEVIQTILDETGFGALFPAQPVAVIGTTMHMGTPHTHAHPPSTTPAGVFPLPSFGVAFLAGSASVLVNGVPALRAGDIGLGLTCGSMAPPFEIMTGASGVFFGGSRVARLGMDITAHCNPMPAGSKALQMAAGIAGAVVSAAGAAAQASAGNTGAAIAQAAQAALDSAALAISMLRGADPAGPPGVGVLLGPPTTVLAGGPPIPNLGALAQGALYSALRRAMRAAAGRVRRPTQSCDANGRRGDGGEPVSLVTGANFNTHRDFASAHGGFVWSRHTSSAKSREHSVLGWGWKHCLENTLRVRLHRAVFETFDGDRIEFPRIRHGQTLVRAAGYVLRQLSPTRFTVSHRRLGTYEFVRNTPDAVSTHPVSVLREKARIELIHDSVGRLVEVRETSLRTPVAPRARYTLHYDQHHHLVEVRGGLETQIPKRLIAYGYDLRGRLTTTEDARGSREHFSYDIAHRITEATDRNGFRYRYQYDLQGRCVFASGEDNLWWSKFDYSKPRQTRYELHDGSARIVHYDDDGVITKIVDPYGGVLKRIRDADGRVVAEIDSGGREMKLLYDEDDAHYARMDRFGNLYPPQVDQPGLPDPFVRDLPTSSRERVLGELAPCLDTDAGAASHRIPDPLLDLAASVFRAPRAAREPVREVDAYGRPIREVDAHGRVQEWQYDRAGNVVLYRDRDGREHRKQIRSWNLVGAQIDPLGATTRYSHNPHEHITEIVDPLGTVSAYDYDSKDRVVRVHRDGRIREEYDYDLGDRMTAKRDANGVVLMRVTPHENGLVGRYELRDGEVIDLDYDENGNVTRADTHTHKVWKSWDALRRRLRDRCDDREVRHWYDGEDLRVTVVGRFTTRYERGHNDLVSIIAPTGRTWTMEPVGPGTVQIDHGNGAREIQQYDPDGRLLGRLLWKRADDGSLVSWAARLDYSDEGDLRTAWDSIRGRRHFEVDAAHRLIAEIGEDGVPHSYRHDAAGNLLSKPGLPLVQIGRANRLVSAADEQFEYDHRDHIVVRRSNAAETRYFRDGFDQIVRIEDDAGEPWTATYDGLGRRITAGRGDRLKLFWWDGDRVAAETFPSGQLRIYVYAGARSLVPIGFVDYASADAESSSGRSYSVFSDQVGMPLHIEDERGEIVWWADRVDPYGHVVVNPASVLEYNLRWPGHYYDSDTGLHYNRFRYYDPWLGRYLESDPIGCAGGVNLYAYPANPLVSVDVLGLHNEHNHPAQEGSQGHPDREAVPRSVASDVAASRAHEPRTDRRPIGVLTTEEARAAGVPLPSGARRYPNRWGYDTSAGRWVRNVDPTSSPREHPSRWAPPPSDTPPSTRAEIETSRRAAAAAADEQARIRAQRESDSERCVAAVEGSDRPYTRSGEIGDDAERYPGYASRSSDEMMARSDEIGHELQDGGANDFNGPGSAASVHCEKQHAVAHPGEAVGVGLPMCRDCRNYFRVEAAAQGRDLVVTDPNMTRVFHPDGSVTEYRPDGSVYRGASSASDPY
ncbi:RHS repeat-associated core domain-containing protein [Sandaracinus amylolyticus]|uniref:RHS repeat-associated core domain-containing protein n=1 Tax=Sandaracinus amylolyticus TaxID=927083 RepID=UPI001470440A|nr:RHS repeat-associated core domain-containing protein [Sandaracinus amylolyticus]